MRRHGRIIIQFNSKESVVLPRGVIHPDKPWRAYFDLFMMLLVCYYAIVTPVNIAYENSPFDIFILEMIFNGFFVIDIILQFFTSFKHEKGHNAGRFEISHKKIIYNYITSWFFIDVIASFPMELVMKQNTGGSLNRLVRLARGVKLMRILRMSRIWKRILARIKINPSIVRLFKWFVILLVQWHWIGCLYWGIAVSEGFEDGDPDEARQSGWSPSMVVLDMTFTEQYIRAYYWAVMVTTGVGRDVIPKTNAQYIFTILSIVIGVLMYALIVGSVGSAFQSIDSPETQKRKKLESVREYLRQRNVSESLTDAVINYYEYCYSRHITEHDEKILENIHSVLKEKLELEMNQGLLQKVKRFKQLPDALLLVLIHSLISRIYLPNELVYLIGERAHEMIFVARGDLEELNKDGDTQRFLTDGDFFGDQLFEAKARRDTTVRCITHCELLILTRNALKKIMKLFPEFAMMVQRWSGQDTFQRLKGWNKIKYIIKTRRVMRMFNSDVSLEQIMDMLANPDKHYDKMREAQKSVFSPEIKIQKRGPKQRQMTYSQFSNNYAKVFTKDLASVIEEDKTERDNDNETDITTNDDDNEINNKDNDTISNDNSTNNIENIGNKEFIKSDSNIKEE